MASLAPLIPPDALSLCFLSAGSCLQTPHGWVLQKIVPATVIAQSLFGTYEITCEGRTEIIRSGEAFLSPANRAITLTMSGDPAHGGWMGARWAHLHFTLFDTLDLISLLDLPLRIEAQAAGRLGEIIQALVDAGEAPDPHAVRGLAHRHQLAFSALRVLCEIASPRPECETILRHSGRLAEVFAHIHGHLGESISVAHLARLSHMSLSRFHTFFRQHIGCTPTAYIKKIRLNEACKHLVANDDPVAQIAERVGFANQFHFSREFKASFRMTPTQYRISSSGSRYEETEIASTLHLYQ